MIYSDWQTVSYSQVGSNYYATMGAPKLTQAILDKGEIAVYMRYTDGVTPKYYYRKLADIYVSASGTVDYVKISALSVGRIHLQASFNAANYSYRYVLIPGGVQATANRNIDLKNYAEVATVFNIKN